MPTFESAIHNHQPLIDVQVSLPGVSAPNPHIYVALLDTGAQFTSVSHKIPQEMGLIAIGAGDMLPASGQVINTSSFILG